MQNAAKYANFVRDEHSKRYLVISKVHNYNIIILGSVMEFASIRVFKFFNLITLRSKFELVLKNIISTEVRELKNLKLCKLISKSPAEIITDYNNYIKIFDLSVLKP